MTTILLVPADNDPHKLTVPGACGATVPLLYSGRLCGHESHRRWTDAPRNDCYMCRNAISEALVLAHDNEPVLEGITRAAGALAALEGVTRGCGVLWCPGSQMRAYALMYGNSLGQMIRYGAYPIRGEWQKWEREVSALNDPPALTKPLLPAWALAAVCAARLGGSVVVL